MNLFILSGSFLGPDEFRGACLHDSGQPHHITNLYRTAKSSNFRDSTLVHFPHCGIFFGNIKES